MNKRCVVRLLVIGLMVQTSQASLYAGADLGLNNAQFRATFFRNLSALVGPYGEFQTNKNGYNSFIGGIFAGWSYQSGIFSAGIEIGGNLDSLNEQVYKFTSQTDIEDSIKLTRRGGFDAALRFGYHPTPQSFFYAKVGINYSKIRTTWAGIDANTTSGTTYRNSAKASRNAGAFKASLGYEGFLTSRWAIRGEMSYIFPINHALNIGSYSPPAYFLEQTQIKFRSSQTAFKVGIAYHFL
ncbi:outer membrane protein [Candidatus Odyssella thessalonicensis]|uniref:outer membrane protein n=1 Tax=Candidatus Odyssella thessalonicensis TaxID=84647 RepID=UPI000225AE9B|nr:outer membrane beta-barrel protein [Candidatus Odyssella thessalonicensis]